MEERRALVCSSSSSSSSAEVLVTIALFPLEQSSWASTGGCSCKPVIRTFFGGRVKVRHGGSKMVFICSALVLLFDRQCQKDDGQLMPSLFIH